MNVDGDSDLYPQLSSLSYNCVCQEVNYDNHYQEIQVKITAESLDLKRTADKAESWELKQSGGQEQSPGN
jgi:hypothetical protein